MASIKKYNKLKNAFLCKGALKNKEGRCKRLQFYTPSERKKLMKRKGWNEEN